MSVEVCKDKVIPASAQAVWELLSDFGNMAWAGFPDVIVEGEGIGSIRKVLVSPDGARAIERLDFLDNTNRLFSYSVVAGNPLPVHELRGQVTVEELDAGSSKVTWEATAEPEAIETVELERMLTGMYGAVLDKLAAVFL